MPREQTRVVTGAAWSADEEAPCRSHTHGGGSSLCLSPPNTRPGPRRSGRSRSRSPPRRSSMRCARVSRRLAADRHHPRVARLDHRTAQHHRPAHQSHGPRRERGGCLRRGDPVDARLRLFRQAPGHRLGTRPRGPCLGGLTSSSPRSSPASSAPRSAHCARRRAGNRRRPGDRHDELAAQGLLDDRDPAARGIRRASPDVAAPRLPGPCRVRRERPSGRSSRGRRR